MAKQEQKISNNTKVVTGEVRFRWAHVFTPQAAMEGGEAKFSVTILIPKADTATKDKIDAAIAAAKARGLDGTWNHVAPPNLKTPVWDGDGVKADGTPFGEEAKGCWVLTARSRMTNPPGVVDAQCQPILDASEVYGGMYGRVSMGFYPYGGERGIQKGIGCILYHVQKLRDGEPMGARQSTAAEDFGGAGNGEELL